MANYLVLVENAKYRLGGILQTWDPQTRGQGDDSAWRKLSADLIVIAYARLFGQLDVEAFWRGLASVAATARGYLAERAPLDHSRRAPASWNEALLCAVACGDLALAREIAEFFATDRADIEYADEFERAAFFRRLLREDGPLSAAGERIRAACSQIEADLDEAPAFLDFFRAIGNGDPREITLALEGWGQRIEAEVEARAALPSAPPEASLLKGLWLEGLAYVRLLESLGVTLPVRVPLVPGPVRNPPRGALNGLDLLGSGAASLGRL